MPEDGVIVNYSSCSMYKRVFCIVRRRNTLISLHSRSMIKVFVVSMKKNTYLDVQKAPGEYSDQTAHADLNLRWAQLCKGTFSDVATHVVCGTE